MQLVTFPMDVAKSARWHRECRNLNVPFQVHRNSVLHQMNLSRFACTCAGGGLSNPFSKPGASPRKSWVVDNLRLPVALSKK